VITREDIIAAAKLSEIVSANYRYDSTDEADWIDIERFYAIAFEAGRVAEREECAKNAGEFARKWWSIHCATNRHLETTRAAHDDFCALQIVIRARSLK